MTHTAKNFVGHVQNKIWQVPEWILFRILPLGEPDRQFRPESQ